MLEGEEGRLRGAVEVGEVRLLLKGQEEQVEGAEVVRMLLLGVGEVEEGLLLGLRLDVEVREEVQRPVWVDEQLVEGEAGATNGRPRPHRRRHCSPRREGHARAC